MEAQKAQQQVVPRRCWRHQKTEKWDVKHVHLLDTRMRPDILVIHPSDTDTVAYEWVSMAYDPPDDIVVTWPYSRWRIPP